VNFFYASFIPGLQNIISVLLKERLSDVKIYKLLDGAVLFETSVSYDKLNFLCFNNIFSLLNILEDNKNNGAIETYIRSVIGNSSFAATAANNSKIIRSFRIVVSDENIPITIDKKLKEDAERYISRLSSLKVDRSCPDTEFWFLYRREGFFCFMKRLTLRSSWEKTLHKGELPPPLAWIMCRLACPVYTDILLDPFCGYGSIAQAALKHFHIAKFIACDNDNRSANFTVSRFRNRKKEDFVFYKNDFCNLPSLIEENSIDAVITDPPWGHYREFNDDNFYGKMFMIFKKLLKNRGKAVVLCANSEAFSESVPSCFTMLDNIPILLSGKKAQIYSFAYIKAG
jgi:predicted RNA methylase